MPVKQGVIGLDKTYGRQRLEAACARALAFGSGRYRTVKDILRKGLDQQPLDLLTPTPLGPAHTGQGCFCRDTTSLFKPSHTN